MDWEDEVNKRPAPVILASLAGLAVIIAGYSPSLRILYGIAVILGLYSIQISIWRAAQQPAIGAEKGPNEN